MALEIRFTGLEAPWGEVEVGSDGTRALEADWIIDSGLEGQRGDEADTGRRHQALADRIGVRCLTGAIAA